MHGRSRLRAAHRRYAGGVPVRRRRRAGRLDAVWWAQFGDPVLDALVAESLANNRNVKIAAANVEQAAGFLMSTRAALFPQAAYGGGAARQRMSQNDATFSPLMQNPFNSFQAFGGVSWEIDLGAA